MRFWTDVISVAPRLAASRVTKEIAKLSFAAAVVGAIGLATLFFATPLPARLQAGDSAVVYYSNDLPAHVFLSEDDKWRIAVELDDVEPAYREALVRFEDKRYWSHWGVDPIAIARALWLNVTFGRRMSGASTITMQLVRVLEPRPRTYASKAIEAFRAMQLEARMSKEEILAAYLTYIPYGRNVEGIEAASLAYFGHSASELSPAEIATLLAVPQNPNVRYPAPANVERLRAARDEIAAWLAEEGMLPLGLPGARIRRDEAIAMVTATDVPGELQPFPREMPHVAYWLRAREPDRREFRTTLDAGVQLVAERVVENHRQAAWDEHIDSASVVVVDRRTGDVVALVGNFDFFSDRPGAQLPGFDVARSPGSLLKPLIFAMGIERGVAHPRHLVLDIPQTFAQYTPNNYDGRFRGLVRLDESLSRSLNVPFIRLLNEIGVDQMIGELRAMDAQHLIDEPGYYGLSAAIGGVELTALEVAGIYSALGGDGAYRPLRILREGGNDAAGVQVRVVGEEAAWLTRRALRSRDRPGYARRRANPDARQIWWKTGTSYGHRDAWAAGGGDRYVAVAWLGNMDQRGSTALVGADRAGPVLFDVLEAVDVDDDGRRDPRPEGLVKVEVCEHSGHLPTDACEGRARVWAPARSVPTARCPYHVRVDVDVATGEALAPHCRLGRDYESKSFLVWPPELRKFATDHNRIGPALPELADDCAGRASTKPPRILSPPHGQTIVLMPGVGESQQEVPLEAQSDFAAAELSWFVNGEFLGTVPADGRMWWTPAAGEHELVVVDGAGHSSRRIVRVR